MRTLLLAAALILTACAHNPSESGWTGKNAQPFDTAVAACNQISRGNTNDFTVCMAGRGWTRIKK